MDEIRYGYKYFGENVHKSWADLPDFLMMYLLQNPMVEKDVAIYSYPDFGGMFLR